MLLRIGVNIGEVVVDGDDIYGDGVNVAARLQAIAPAGGICLSGKVHDEIEGKVDASFKDVGAQEVKNIARPVQVWCWAGLYGGTVVGRATSAGSPRKLSVAVLPFDNMSDDPAQEYFADGIAEDIITELSKCDWLDVTARNSTFAYKGKAVDISSISRDLGVRYVLEGSVRRAGGRVRITAQLIHAESGNHVWAERYDRSLGDIFAVQDEITDAVVTLVDSELRNAETSWVRRKAPENLDAWENYHRGIAHLYNLTQREIFACRPFFAKAIAQAPDFAPPYAGMAECHYMEVVLTHADDPAAVLQRAFEYGQRAVALDHNNAYAHYALGRVRAARGEYELAVAELETALSLNKNYAMAYAGLAANFIWAGRASEAIGLLERAEEISPRDVITGGNYVMRATAYNRMGDHAKAERFARLAVAKWQDAVWPHVNLAESLLLLDRKADAIAALDEAYKVQPRLSLAMIRRSLPAFHSPYIEAAIENMRTLGVPEA
jgi:adenylate cyclase